MRSLRLLTGVAASAALMGGCTSSRSNSSQNVVEETYVHQYGVQIPENEWSDRGEHGKVISTLSDGVKVTKSYVDGVQHGETTHTFPHSEDIEKIKTYSHGNLVQEVHHYRSGVPCQRIQYFPPNHSVVTHWYENGSPMCNEEHLGQHVVQGEYYNPTNQLESRVDQGGGVRIKRDAYGQLQSHETIFQGTVASSETYHPNGTPKEVTTYFQGRPEGVRKTFTPAGEPNTIEEWRNGQQTGTTSVFQNGEKIADVPYLNGEKHGVERRYRDGSKVVEEISWKHDRRHGPTHTYIGENAKTQWYFNNRQLSKYNYDQMSLRKRDELEQEKQ